MYIYAGIDGTGPGNRTRYAMEFANSFVKRLSRDARWSKSYCLQGPTWAGETTYTKAKAMRERLETHLHVKG